MNNEEMRDLIREFYDSPLSFLEIKDGDTYLKMKKPMGQEAQPIVQQVPVFAQPAAPMMGAQVPAPVPVPQADISASVSQEAVADDDVVEIVSPLVGVFYEAPAPGEKPFVAVGDHVEEGDVVCLMEAMKMISEVKAPCAGTIVEICAVNGEAVGCDEVLMKIEED